jgi:hypothetical protein
MAATLIASPSALGETTLEQITLLPDVSLSDGFHSEVDLLFVFDSGLVNALPFTQFEWISGRSDYLAESQALEVVTVVVDSETGPVEIHLTGQQRTAAAVLVFASHADPVAEAIDVTRERRIELQIMPYGINVVSR